MMNFAGQTAAAVSAIILLTDYLFGVVFGMFGGVVFGSVLENHRMTLLGRAPDPLSAGTRAILGLFVRDDGYLGSLPPGRRTAVGGAAGEDPSGPAGQGVNQ